MLHNLNNKMLFSIITLVVFLCTLVYPKTNTADEKLKVIHDKTFSLLPGSNLILDASSGDVIISSWDKNEVNIKILGNDQAKEKVNIIFKESKEGIKVQAKYGWALSNIFKKILLKFEVKVPHEFNIDASTAGGEIKLQDIKGKISAKTSGGQIDLVKLSGRINASTSGGDILFNELTGNIEIETSGGDIKGKQFSGDLKVSTTGGDISLVGMDSKISGSTSGGDIDLDYKGKNQGIELSTSGGDIIVTLPADFNASADLSALGGNVKCDFKGNNAVKISSSKFEADINNGGNPLKLKTSGGEIILRKK